MDHECLRTDGLSRRYRGMNILPDYGCLILSPANLWSKDSVLFQVQPTKHVETKPKAWFLHLKKRHVFSLKHLPFQMDSQLVSTVFNYQRSREGHSSMTDLVFGLRQRETGITKYPIRNRSVSISV